MKWLLVTTVGPNPGDAFVRVGVERLVAAVDPEARIELVNKHTRAVGRQVPVDRVVWCGMPLLWCHNEHRCWVEGWWGPLMGWLSAPTPAGKSRLLMAGVGSFCRWPDGPNLADPDELRARAWALYDRVGDQMYARDPWLPGIAHLPRTRVLPCPSIFAPGSADIEPLLPGVKLCNLMPAGSHYPDFNPHEARQWDFIKWRLAAGLRARGFTFVAHCKAEFEFASRAGWPDERIWSDSHDPKRLLGLYAGCSTYVGNRVHGAIVAKAAGARVLCIGYDSRQEAVRLVGGDVRPPHQMGGDYLDSRLDEWLAADEPQATLDVDAAWLEQLEIFRGFAR